MGMFDTIRFKCTNCGVICETQSKAGSCELNEYEIGKTIVPASIAEELEDCNITCLECDYVNTFLVQTIVNVTVA